MVPVGAAVEIEASNFRASCRGRAPFAGLLSVEVVQGDDRLLLAQATPEGSSAGFKVTSALPPAVHLGPAAIEVRPADDQAPRSAVGVAQLVVGVDRG